MLYVWNQKELKLTNVNSSSMLCICKLSQINKGYVRRCLHVTIGQYRYIADPIISVTLTIAVTVSWWFWYSVPWNHPIMYYSPSYSSFSSLFFFNIISSHRYIQNLCTLLANANIFNCYLVQSLVWQFVLIGLVANCANIVLHALLIYAFNLGFKYVIR